MNTEDVVLRMMLIMTITWVVTFWGQVRAITEKGDEEVYKKLDATTKRILIQNRSLLLLTCGLVHFITVFTFAGS